MTTNFEDTLKRVMETIPRMQPCSDVDALLREASKGGALRGYVTGKPIRIRVSKQVDLEMDALIHDGELGSLGVIHRVDSASGNFDDEVRRKIDDAAYLRHLLVEEMRTTGNANRSPYAVEVVLLVEAAGALGETLRTILRDGAYLHAVGVNVWLPEDGTLTAPAAVRRAFSWLLAETEEWFVQRGPDVERSPQQPLQKIELENFRLAGKRAFELDSEQQLQLVHGHNGSGKSALSEALELIVSGKVQRLDQQDHAVCLTSRDVRKHDAMAKASVTIQRGSVRRTWEVEANGIPDPLGTMPPDAFRLDQTVADRLTHSTSADRARFFLSAFFGAESQGLQRRTGLLDNARSQFVNLPPKIADSIGKKSAEGYELDVQLAREELQWLAEPGRATWEKFLSLMPLTAAQVHDLGAILPHEIGERFVQMGRAEDEKLTATARALDEALTTLLHELTHRIEMLTNAVEVLEQYGHTRVSGATETGGDLPTLLRQWQRLHALADLLAREEQIRLTIEDALRRGHNFSTEPEPILKSILSNRTEVVRTVSQRRDAARDRVMAFASGEEQKAASGKAPPPKPLNFDALTAAADIGTFGEELKRTKPPLGQALRDALSQGRPVKVQTGSRTLQVGTQRWGLELLARAKAALAALTQIADARAELPSGPRKLEALLPALRELYKTATEIAGIDAQDVDRLTSLFAENGELRQALNELTALLTPARWAYRDVIPAADLKGTAQSFELQADRITQRDGTTAGISARFLLNTAELNTLALSLFLLCARRVPNPLRILVLDDPLQNMDELTVTTIARGFARILRLWKRHLDAAAVPWRVFMLLHAEDDVERIRAEAACATYFLPWLTPCDGGSLGHETVRPVSSMMLSELQRLDSVIEPRL